MPVSIEEGKDIFKISKIALFYKTYDGFLLDDMRNCAFIQHAKKTLSELLLQHS